MSLALTGALAVVTAAIAVGLMPGAATRPIPSLAHPDRAALRDAGWSMAAWRWELMRVGLVVATAIGATLADLPLVIAAIGAALPSIVVRLQAEAARDRSRSATARLLQTTHSALRSGVTLPEALRRSTHACDDAIARRPFDCALRQFGLGDALDRALLDAVELASDDRARDALTTLAVGVAERLPIERAAALVGAVADRAAYEEQLDMEVRARASGARAQARILAATVPALALYLAATMPGLAGTLMSPLGRTVLLPGALGLEVLGIVLGRRIVRAATR